MGKQKGLVLLTGRLDGIIFYKSGGQYLTRIWDGHSRERILTNPAFARVRENNMEFGGAATAAKAFRAAFAGSIRHTGDRYMTGRLTQAFKKMCVHGSGERGQRSISPSAYPEPLIGFEFNAQQPLGNVLDAPFSLATSPGRNAVTLTLPSIYPKPPVGASHFRLVLALGCLAEHVYDHGAKEYVASAAAWNGLGTFTAGELLPLDTDNGPISLTAGFVGASALPADVAVAVAFGVRFYRPVNGVPYAFEQGHAMRIVAMG